MQADPRPAPLAPPCLPASRTAKNPFWLFTHPSPGYGDWSYRRGIGATGRDAGAPGRGIGTLGRVIRVTAGGSEPQDRLGEGGEILSKWHHRNLSTEPEATCSGSLHLVGGHRKAQETGSNVSEAGWSWHAREPARSARAAPGPSAAAGGQGNPCAEPDPEPERAQEVPGGAPAVEWEGGDADSRKKSSGKNCPGKPECLQAPGNHCPQWCCFLRVLYNDAPAQRA